jgi:hypothetical protein
MAVEAVFAPMDMRLRSRRERDIVGWTMPNVFVRRHRWLRLRGGTWQCANSSGSPPPRCAPSLVSCPSRSPGREALVTCWLCPPLVSYSGISIPRARVPVTALVQAVSPLRLLDPRSTRSALALRTASKLRCILHVKIGHARRRNCRSRAKRGDPSRRATDPTWGAWAQLAL